MPKDRKELVMEEEMKPKRPVPDAAKLRKELEDGNLLLAMTNTPGWKKLSAEFIVPRTHKYRFLAAPASALAETRAAMAELEDLVLYISTRVENGIKAWEALKENPEK